MSEEEINLDFKKLLDIDVPLWCVLLIVLCMFSMYILCEIEIDKCNDFYKDREPINNTLFNIPTMPRVPPLDFTKELIQLNITLE